MKYVSKVSARIVVALAVGLLLASISTKITYTCIPTDDARDCLSFEKAVMHPDDLLSNKDGSLAQFSTTLVLSSLVIFTLLSAISVVYKKKLRNPTSKNTNSNK